MASVIRSLCKIRGLVARGYYGGMAAYRAAGRLTESDRTSLRGMTDAEQQAELDRRYGQGVIPKVALADFDCYPVRAERKT